MEYRGSCFKSIQKIMGHKIVNTVTYWNGVRRVPIVRFYQQIRGSLLKSKRAVVLVHESLFQLTTEILSLTSKAAVVTVGKQANQAFFFFLITSAPGFQYHLGIFR